jgi:hypothetical protein
MFEPLFTLHFVFKVQTDVLLDNLISRTWLGICYVLHLLLLLLLVHVLLLLFQFLHKRHAFHVSTRQLSNTLYQCRHM